jgi:RHS repeat-associated protein
VDVLATNKGPETFSGLIVVAIDGVTGTTGAVRPDGFSLGSPSSPFFQLQLPAAFVDGQFGPGRATQPRTIALGFVDGAGPPKLTTKIFIQPVGQAFSLALTRSLDGLGQPLPGAQVTETGPQGERILATDSEYGIVTLGQGPGEHAWRFDSPGHLPVWRNGSVPLGNVRLIPSPRLASRSTNLFFLAGGAASQMQDAATNIQITIPAGAFSESVDGTLTPLDGQTLPGILAQGWSPLSAFWIELSQWPSQPLSAQLRPSAAIATNETAVLARWDTNLLAWVASQKINGNGTNQVTVSVSGPGSYALVVPDTGTVAPPPATLGQALPRSTTSWPASTALAASGNVNPASSQASRLGEEVTAKASLRIASSTTPTPSGFILRCDLRENYLMQDGSSRFTPQYENYIFTYQRPGDTDLRTVHASFPIRPLLLFGSDELAAGKVTVDVLPLGNFSGGVFETGGNFIEIEGIRVTAKAGAFDRQQAAQIRRLDPTDFASLMVTGLTVQAAFDLTVEGTATGQALSIQVSNLPPTQSFVLARLISDTRLLGLEPVERLSSNTNRVLSTLEPVSGLRLPGVTKAGQYLLVQVGGAQALLSGVIRNPAGQLLAGAPVRVEGQPWLTLSGTDGVYRVIAPTGAVRVTATDPATGNSDQVDSTVSGGGAAIDFSTGPHGPRVTSVSPANLSTNVPRVTAITVSFSKPINPGSFVEAGLQLLDPAGQAVPGAVSLNLANTSATLLPNEELAPNASYIVVVSTNLSDRDGRLLEGSNTAQFTTLPAPVDRTGAALTSYEPVNGQAALVGTPGTAEGSSPVILVNETSGRTSTVLSRADGSFSNSIPAEVDDTLSIVVVNQNGSRNVVPVTRQLFLDGSVGLFSSGGMLEVTNENGTAQFIIEPGAIEKKTVFKVEAVSLQETRNLLGNTQPTNGAVLSGFKLGALRGSPLKHQIEVNVPINPGQLELLPGANPTNATFGLGVARMVDGNQVFQLVDSPRYEEGRLVTHSWDDFLGYLEDTFLVLLKLSPGPMTELQGRVVVVKVDNDGHPDLDSEKTVAGALVRGSENTDPQSTKLPGGAVYSVSSSAGRYHLLTVAGALSATHPRFPNQRAEGVAPPPPPSPTPGAGSVPPRDDVDLRFVLPEAGTGVPPLISLSHVPFWQDKGGTFTITVNAIDDDSPPTIKLETESVSSLAPGETVTESDITITPLAAVPDPANPKKVTQEFKVSTMFEALLKLRVSAVDGFQNKNVQFHILQFGGPPPSTISGVIPASDPRDRTGPKVLWSIPEAKDGTLTVGLPITIKFDEAISTDILNQPSAVTMDPAREQPLMQLSDDQTVLTLLYLDLEPKASYKLTLSGIQDLKGNRLDQDPIAAGDQDFVMEFTAGDLVSGELEPGVTDLEGTGAIVHGHYAFVLEQTGPSLGKLVVFDLSDPQAPRKVQDAERGLAARPRDLVLIPHYSFVYVDPSIYHEPAQRRQVTKASFDKILTLDLLVVVGGSPGLRSILRVFDVTKPEEPFLMAGTELNGGESVATRVKWSAPTLYYLETGASTRISSLNLQSHLIGKLLQENNAEFVKLGSGTPGLDVNEDGDYADVDLTPPEEPPFPSAKSGEFPGKIDSYGLSDSSQTIRDFVIEDRGAFQAAVVLPGLKKDKEGNELIDEKLPGGYRTLWNKGDPVFLDEGFFPIVDGSPRRLFTMFGEPIKIGDETKLLDLALISVSPLHGSSDPSHLLVLGLTNRLSPVKLLDIPMPKVPGATNLFSIYRRGDGLLMVASETNSFLVDPAKFGPGILDPAKAKQAVVGMIPGAGGDGWTFGVSDSGLIVSGRLPLRPAFALRPPVIEIVAFPEEDPFVPEDWLQTNPTDTEIFERLDRRQTAAALRLARYKEEDRFCVSTLKDPTTKGARSVHYYALVKGVSGDPTGSRDYIELALESLNWAGAPLKKRGFLFPPVHGFSPETLDQEHLDQATRPPEDAEVRTCKAWRLSNKPDNPLYHMYLSRPFSVVGESLSRQELDELDSTLHRDILWSGHFLRVSIEPIEDRTAGLKPFIGQVKDGSYHPGVFTTVRSLPADLLQSPNPMPIGGGGTTVALAGGLVGAHNSELIVDSVDLAIPGRRLPVAFSRHYSGQALYHGPFGRGWDINYNQRLVELSRELIVPGYTNPVVVRAEISDSEYGTNRDILFYNGSGRVTVYTRAGADPPPEVATDPLVLQLSWAAAGGKAGPAVADYYLPPPGNFSPLFRFKDGRFATLSPDGTQHWFNQAGRLIAIYDRFEVNSIQLSYGEEGELISISSDGGTATNPFRLYVGYFRNPNPAFLRPADIVTNAPGLAGRICRLMDYTTQQTGREVSFTYNSDGDLEERHNVDVQTQVSPNGYGVMGRQVTRYSYSNPSDSLARKSLNDIRGPNRGSDVGGVDKTLKVLEFASGGQDMVHILVLGDKKIVTLNQAHGNTAKELSMANPGQTVVDGPISGNVETHQTHVVYEFDPYGRAQNTTVFDGAGSGAPIPTGTLFDTNGLLCKITLPEQNDVQNVYSTSEASVRCRANVTTLTRNPGARGGDVLNAGFKYAGLYNLPLGDQTDFRQKIATVGPTPDSRAIGSIGKGGETEIITYWPDGLIKDRTSSLGVVRSFTYTPEGFLQDESIGDLTTTYDYSDPSGARGLPSSITDPTGVMSGLSYDEMGRLIEITRSVGRETFSYDGAGNLNEYTRIVEAGSGRRLDQHFEYDDFGKLLSKRIEGVEVVTPDGPTTQALVTGYEYDDYDRVKAKNLPAGERQEQEFDHAGRLVDVKLKAFEQEVYHVQFAYDGNGNLVTNQVHNAITSICYDGHDRLREHTSPAGATTTLTHDENDNPLTLSIQDRTGPLYSLSLADYDDLDRPQSVTHQAETGPSTTGITYSPGRLEVALVGPQGDTTTYKTEQVGRKWSETGPLGVRDLTISPENRELTQNIMDDLGSPPTTVHFTEFGQLDKVTDGYSNEYHFSPEVDGRILESRLPTSQGPTDVFRNTFTVDGLPLSSSRPGGQTLMAQYDARGNVVQAGVQFPNGTIKGTTYRYDDAGRLSAAIDANNGVDQVIDPDGNGAFNGYGQPRGIRLARDIQANLFYDAIGRLKSLEYPNNFTTLDYDALNRVTRTSNANGTITNVYGIDGLLKTITLSQFGTNWVLEQHHDSEGARVELVYSDGADVSFGPRGPRSRLLTVQIAGEPIVESSTYAGGGLISARALGNGIKLAIGYDKNRRETNRIYKLDGASVAGVSYTRDESGQIIARQLTHAGTTDHFDYDSSQRLTNAVIGATNPPANPATVPAGAYGRTFQYSSTDVLTNSRLNTPQQLSLPAFVSVVANLDDTLFGSNLTFSGTVPVNVVRGRDAAGNTTNGLAFVRQKAALVSAGAPADAFTMVPVTYTYNELNQLVFVQREDGVSITNVYGPNGLRIRRTVHGPAALGVNSDLEYIYDGANLIEVRDFTKNREIRSRFYYGDNGDELLAGDFFDPGSTVPKRFYYLTDSLGSPMAIADASGSVVEFYLYDAWGEATVRPPAGGTGSLTPSAKGIHTRSLVGSPFYFQGQVYDEDAGLIYMRARFYDAALGVFLQIDPAGYIDSGNQYAGFRNNPIGFKDPTGTTTVGEWLDNEFTNSANQGDKGGIIGYSFLSAVWRTVGAEHISRFSDKAGGSKRTLSTGDYVFAGLEALPVVAEALPVIRGAGAALGEGAAVTGGKVANWVKGVSRAPLQAAAAKRAVTWTRNFPAGTGETDWYGNITLSRLGSAIDRAQVAAHEAVHSFLRVSQDSFLANLRAGWNAKSYHNSVLLKYTEETLAETVAQVTTRHMTGNSIWTAIQTGAKLPLNNNAYSVGGQVLTGSRVLSHAGAWGAAYGAGVYGTYRISDYTADLWQDWFWSAPEETQTMEVPK